MNDVMGIIYTSKDDLNLRELTAYRAVAALPVVGPLSHYRFYALQSGQFRRAQRWRDRSRRTIIR